MGIHSDSDGRRAVFLDRDGVINRAVIRGGKAYAPASVDEFELLPGVSDAVRRLKAAGFLLVVVTNQPDVARGTAKREDVEAIHARLRVLLPDLDDIRTCYHDDVDNCPCRKPRPGMLMDAARDFGIDLRRSYLVGDRWRDIEAGQAAGCTTILVDYGYAERQPARPPDKKVASLAEAADWILGRGDGRRGLVGDDGGS